MLGGAAAVSFSGVILGLELVAEAGGAVMDSDTLKVILTWASHKPVLAAVVGAAATAAVHSSSVVSALLVTLTREGLVELEGSGGSRHWQQCRHVFHSSSCSLAH
jgi:Na+/phosphate symporter